MYICLPLAGAYEHNTIMVTHTHTHTCMLHSNERMNKISSVFWLFQGEYQLICNSLLWDEVTKLEMMLQP